MELYEITDYRSEIPFLFNNYIREYDIRKANINILYKNGILSEKDYNFLLQSPRDVRQYVIGNMQKDENINNTLMKGFKECRKLFIECNYLEESDILSIKKDAIFVINKIPKYCKFDNIEFVNKNVYTSYISFFNKRLELYYSSGKTNIEKIDVKGISDNNLKYHEKYMLDFLYFVFEMIENDGLENTILCFNRFYDDYINKRLEIGYYRNFNSQSGFTLNFQDPFNKNRGYEIFNEKIALTNFDNINISYNMNLLRILFQYLSSLQFKRK